MSTSNASAPDTGAVVSVTWPRDAFERGATAVARSPGPRGARVQDTFSLRGFTASYEAINKACPAR